MIHSTLDVERRDVVHFTGMTLVGMIQCTMLKMECYATPWPLWRESSWLNALIAVPRTSGLQACIHPPKDRKESTTPYKKRERGKFLG